MRPIEVKVMIVLINFVVITHALGWTARTDGLLCMIFIMLMNILAVLDRIYKTYKKQVKQ
jgi:hypothetical protein